MTHLVQDARDFNTLAEFLARRDVPRLDAAALKEMLGAPRADMVRRQPAGGLPSGGTAVAGRACPEGDDHRRGRPHHRRLSGAV